MRMDHLAMPSAQPSNPFAHGNHLKQTPPIDQQLLVLRQGDKHELIQTLLQERGPKCGFSTQTYFIAIKNSHSLGQKICFMTYSKIKIIVMTRWGKTWHLICQN